MYIMLVELYVLYNLVSRSIRVGVMGNVRLSEVVILGVNFLITCLFSCQKHDCHIPLPSLIILMSPHILCLC